MASRNDRRVSSASICSLLDNELQSTTTIPFVFLSQPSPTMLEAAGVIASWFGVVSGSHPVRFAVSLEDIPFGNAIILASNRSALPSDLQIPGGNGPVLALRNNPSGPVGTLLVLAGDNDTDVLSIARTPGAGAGKAPAGQWANREESNLAWRYCASSLPQNLPPAAAPRTMLRDGVAYQQRRLH